MAATITYLGGPETGNVDKCEWGGFVFEKDKPYTVDMRGKDEEKKRLLTHILKKAHTNKFFKVSGDDPPQVAPPAPTPPRPFGAAAEGAQNAVPDRHQA